MRMLEEARTRIARGLGSIPEPPLAYCLVLLIGLLCYAPLLSQLGFYRDDWYVLWAGEVFGPRSLITLFSIDRPVMGYLYAFTYSLFGPHPLAWQVYSLALRLAGAAAFLWLARRLWPGRPFQTTAMALLFIAYPGFLQQPNANTFSNQLFGYALSIFSICLTLLAVQSESRIRKALFTLLALATAGLYWLLYEYMIGMEGLRFLLLWLLSIREGADNAWERVRLTAVRFAPYMGAFLINAYWRAFVFRSSRVTTDFSGLLARYFGEPLHMLARLSIETGKDLIESAFVGWVVPAYPLVENAKYRPLLVSLALAGLGATLVLAYRWFCRRRAFQSGIGEGADLSRAREMMRIGALALFLSVAPVVFAGRDIRWDSGFDRYTLHTTVGVSLLLIGLLWRYARPAIRPAIIAALVGLSIMIHFQNAVHWRDFWQVQKDLWWQISWRAPQLVPGTVLVAQIPVDGFYEDYEVWGPAALIYGPVPGQPRVAAQVFSEDTMHKMRLGLLEGRWMRVLVGMPVDYNQVLLIVRPTLASCNHAINGSRPEAPASATGLVLAAAPFSHIERIEPEAEQVAPPMAIFGPEPARGWCYYFEKADLARQRRDWQEVVSLGEQALSENLRPRDVSEWMPFLEGYSNLGLVQQAEQISSRIRGDEFVRHALCDVLAGSPPSEAPHPLMLQLLCE